MSKFMQLCRLNCPAVLMKERKKKVLFATFAEINMGYSEINFQHKEKEIKRREI